MAEHSKKMRQTRKIMIKKEEGRKTVVRTDKLARSLDQMVKKMFQIDEKRQRTSRKGCIVERAGRVA